VVIHVLFDASGRYGVVGRTAVDRYVLGNKSMVT
jgi:hypothetical protein